jgi:hypothetical protein
MIGAWGSGACGFHDALARKHLLHGPIPTPLPSFCVETGTKQFGGFDCPRCAVDPTFLWRTLRRPKPRVQGLEWYNRGSSERWQSGRSHPPRKRAYLNGYREFESPPLRHPSKLPFSPLPPGLSCRSAKAAEAIRSKGCRYCASSFPSFQVQFESTKSSSFRFSLGGCVSNKPCALCANSSSLMPSSM